MNFEASIIWELDINKPVSWILPLSDKEAFFYYLFNVIK